MVDRCNNKGNGSTNFLFYISNTVEKGSNAQQVPSKVELNMNGANYSVSAGTEKSVRLCMSGAMCSSFAQAEISALSM